MKAIVLEIKDGVAAVLCEDGSVRKTSLPCEVGQTIELTAEVVPLEKRRRRWVRPAVAAALALVILGSSYTYTTASAASYVSLDIEESSVEISLNRLGRVINVRPMNEQSGELAALLEDNLRRMPAGQAMDRAFELMDERGYLASEDAALVAGVTANSERSGESLNEALSQSFGARPAFYALEVSPAERREATRQDLSGGRFAYEQQHGPFPVPMDDDREDAESDDFDDRDDLDDDDGELPAAPAMPDPPQTQQSLPGQSAPGSVPAVPVPGQNEAPVPAVPEPGGPEDDDSEPDDLDEERDDVPAFSQQPPAVPGDQTPPGQPAPGESGEEPDNADDDDDDTD